MRFKHTLWAVPLLGVLAFPAVAGPYHGDGGTRYEQRIDRQHTRIKQGIRSGELTRHEAKKLHKQQRRIARLERRYSDDGYLDRHERRTLRRKLDSASERIYRLKHNDRVRYHEPKRHVGHGHAHGYDDNGWILGISLWDRF